jgi:uncharacterized membrane protein
MKMEIVRPQIKLKRTSFDWVLEFVAFAFLLILVTLPLMYLNALPETIPVHFNATGQPDDYGSRSSLWFLPLTGVFMYLMFTILEGFPQIYNYPLQITPENAVIQYRLATRLMRILKTVILLTFSIISFQTIKTATGSASGLGKAFLPVSLLLTFTPIIIYLIKSLNNRHSS